MTTRRMIGRVLKVLVFCVAGVVVLGLGLVGWITGESCRPQPESASDGEYEMPPAESLAVWRRDTVPLEPSVHAIGTVKSFDERQGFGFIAVDSIAEDSGKVVPWQLPDCYVHRSSIADASLRADAKGKRVEFTYKRLRTGKTCFDVVERPGFAREPTPPPEPAAYRDSADRLKWHEYPFAWFLQFSCWIGEALPE